MRRWYRLFGMVGMVLLGTGVPVQAQYQVRPMRLAWTALAGETIRTQVRLINPSPHPARATVTAIDLVQNAKGQWIPQDQPLDQSSQPGAHRRASCRDWIELTHSPDSPITLPAAPLKNGTAPFTTLPITIAIPATASGSYLAALKVVFTSMGHQAVTTINFDYVIPVVLDVLPANIDQVGTPVDHLVADLTISPASLTYQAHPCQTLPVTLTLCNHHPHRVYTATMSPAQTLCDSSGRPYRSWIKAWPTGPVTLAPQQTQSLQFQIVVPVHVQGRFETTLTVTLAPVARHDLVLEYACVIPLHLEVSQKPLAEPNQPLNASDLRILNPRPLEIHSQPQACIAQGTLALYSQQPLRLQGPQPGHPWQCSVKPKVISSYPLTALCIQGPPQKPQAARSSSPIILHIRPVSTDSFNLK